MGQLYNVDAYLKFKDPDAFRRSLADGALLAMIDNGYGGILDDEHSLDTIEGCMKMLTFNAAELASDEITKSSGYDQVWFSHFWASYGWGLVLPDAFEHAAKSLEPGSYVLIWQEGGHFLVDVRKEGVYVEWIEDEDEEDDDDGE